MKHMHIFRLAFITAAALFVLTTASCYTPSPLYGTWADNSGSKIVFIGDGSYAATIVNSEGVSSNYNGTWTVLDNVLIFSKNTGSSIDTEWDIRGSMLYLDWTDDAGGIQSLTLYHISK